MPEWWEVAYPGAPMVKVNGFPRPLYPPDAKEYGKKHSADGPDVIAYKRTISRAGRWKWGTFNDTFSNEFSHGKSGNVIDTGVAGIQRQQKIEATGWIGERTFNTLRSIKIPVGLPHAGEMAMDAEAVKLINKAWDLYHGHALDTQPATTHRKQALDKAISQIGITETGDNDNKYGQWYGMNYQPWCAMFVTWCYEQVGDHPTFVRGSRYSYCPYVVGDARAMRYGLSVVGDDDAIPGDLVLYDWNGDGVYDHIGIFEKWTTGYMMASVIEGNTSGVDQSNGGQVMRRTRDIANTPTTMVRVKEPS